MNAGVPGELRVEHRAQRPPLPDHHGVLAVPGEDLDVRAGAAEQRRADEHARERGGQALHGERRTEGIHLPAEGVALHGHVQQAQAVLPASELRWSTLDLPGEQNRAGAGAPHGVPGCVEGTDGVPQAVGAEQVRHGGALPAGQDQAAQAAEVLWQADLRDLRAQPLEQGAVLAEGALEGEHADARGVTSHGWRDVRWGSGRRC